MPMQHDWLLKNPFYLLNVSCTDNRRRITAAADELGLLLDADECSNAQNALLNPAKRLTAELDWFVDCDPVVAETIRNCIKSQFSITAVTLPPLAALNAALYNFSLSQTHAGFRLGLAIADIDKRFAAIDTVSLTYAINQNREMAQMSEVTEQDVSLELGNKRGQIRHILSDYLSSLNDEEYIPLVTLLARNYVEAAEERDPAVLADIIDQYELRMQAEIEKATQDIETYIDRIKRLGNNDAFQSNIQTLITRVKNWDVLVQPLQLKSKASGMPHRISERLGYNLRNLVLFLTNDKGLHGDAMSLANAMLEVFAEIAALATLFKTDADALRKLVPNQKPTTPAIVPASKNLPDTAPATPSAEKTPKTKRKIRLLVAALVILGCLNIYQYDDGMQKSATIEEQNSQISALKESNSKLTADKKSLNKDILNLENEISQLESRADMIDDIRSFLNTSKASTYNKYKNYYASTNVVIVKVGKTTSFDVTSKTYGTVWWHADTTTYATPKWSEDWNYSTTKMYVTGKQRGVFTLKFTKDDVSDTFYVLVVVV